MKKPKVITMAYGNGGKFTHELIQELFVPAFANAPLKELTDSARISVEGYDPARLVFTTDSHVVTPLVFPGGDIGKLAVNGTINDLAVMGAKPLYLSCGFIIEEGFDYERLEQIVHSMARAANEAGVRIVTGDTKVVEKGAADGLFINTAGIGALLPGCPKGVSTVQTGDVVILSGTLGDHGVAIYSGREGIEFESTLKSDCAAIAPLVELAMKACSLVRVMRDPTRGGLATTLNEFVTGQRFGIEVDEGAVPVREQVQGACELLGFDPLYIANEGKLVLIVPKADASKVVAALKKHPLGVEAAEIGRVIEGDRRGGKVFLKTVVGGERILDMLVGDMLPRIC